MVLVRGGKINKISVKNGFPAKIDAAKILAA